MLDIENDNQGLNSVDNQVFFILSYCKRLEEHFGTKISASSQTVLKLPPETYHKIPSSKGDI